MDAELQRNKEVALEAIRAVLNGDDAALRALSTDDCEYCFGGSLETGGRYSWAQYQAIHGNAVKRRSALDLTLRVGDITAEGDRVAVECDAVYETEPGAEVVYQQWIFLFRIRGGRMAEFKEFYDTLSAAFTRGLVPSMSPPPRIRESLLSEVAAVMTRAETQ
jgi:ketosteroid isomerase-like protein